MTFLVLSSDIAERFLRLSHVGKAMVCIRRTSSQVVARHQHFIAVCSDTNHIWRIVCFFSPPFYLLSHFPWLQQVQDSTVHMEISQVDGENWHIPVWAPPFMLVSLFAANSWNMWGWWRVLSGCYHSTQISRKPSLDQATKLTIPKKIMWCIRRCTEFDSFFPMISIFVVVFLLLLWLLLFRRQSE